MLNVRMYIAYTFTYTVHNLIRNYMQLALNQWLILSDKTQIMPGSQYTIYNLHK